MDLSNYFKNQRNILFPDIKDWTKEYTERRLKHPKNMDWNEWFWFHRSAYTLIKIGIPVTGFINMLIFGGITSLFDIYSLTIIFFIIASVCFYSFVKNVRELKINPSMTFYDLWLRDYKVEK